MDGDAIGTPSYMPLEQAEGDLESIGPHSDVYAVGAMLYHLLAGNPPYVEPGSSPSGRVILDRVKRAPPAAIRTLATAAPAELIAICEKAMARKAAQRYATMAELGDDLRAYLERRVVKAYKTGVVAETRMWVARNRSLAAALVVGFVALGAFGWSQRIAAARAVEIAEKERAAGESDRARVAALDRVLQLSDVKELRDLQVRGKALLDDRSAVYRTYRGYDALISSMQQWIADAESMATRLPTHEATLASIEPRGRRSADGSRLEFDSKEDAWWHDAVFELVSGFRSLSLDDPNAIAVRAMRDRIAEFETIFAHSIGDHRAKWDACIASIADRSQCPQYNGLKIAPQVGLLPIGRDPQSGMWEFWLVDVTGVKPERGADEKLVLTGDFGLVFVLLPGGIFWMGAQSEDPSGRNYDPQAEPHESPVHEVSLAPFFLSKYEMTQHQWILGSRDDAWPYGTKNSREPVDSVSWDDVSTVLPNFFLALPTEAQWEYACRAGTSTPWSTGAEATSLLGSANVDDETVADNIEFAAPVGSLAANAFGMHDMHGNFWEWCLDGYNGHAYTKALDPQTGEHASDRTRGRVSRGGACWYGASRARSAYRIGDDAGARYGLDGVRPRRDLCGD